MMNRIGKRSRMLLLIALASAMMNAFAQKRKVLTLLQTSDMHSRIEPMPDPTATKHTPMPDVAATPSPTIGGMVRRASALQKIRNEQPNVLLFDCGDFSQGTPYYNFFRGEVEVKMMNAMRYTAAAIGNHEFDYGMQNLAQLIRMARFPVLCTNYDVVGTPLEGLIKPYTIVRSGRLRIGIFALAPALKGLVQADKCEGVTFREPVATANDMARKLKKRHRCHLVVCLSHLGADFDTNSLIPQTRLIDLVLGGHSHTLMQEPMRVTNADGETVVLFHTGSNGAFIGHTRVTFD